MAGVEPKDWDANTTSNDVFAYMRQQHKLQVALYKKTKKNPDPSLKWDSDSLSIVGTAMTAEEIQKLLKMRYMQFFMEICTATPDGEVHCQRFEAPRTFFTGEQSVDDVTYTTYTYTNYRGQQQSYQRPKFTRSPVSTGQLYWDVRISHEEYTYAAWSRGVQTRSSTRTTISPHYGKGGFMLLSNVINRRRL